MNRLPDAVRSRMMKIFSRNFDTAQQNYDRLFIYIGKISLYDQVQLWIESLMIHFGYVIRKFE